MHSGDKIDKFVVFIPKNDPGRIYIARESHIAKCRWFDEYVFPKPLAERVCRELNESMARACGSSL